MDAVIKSALVVLRKFVSPQSNLLDPEASTLHRRDVNKDVLPPPFLAVHFRMLSRGLVLVLGGLQVVTECNPGVMRRLLVVARLMMLAGLTMVFGSVFIVLRRLFVVLVNLELCHFILPDISSLQIRLTATGIQLTRQIVYELIARPAV